MLKILPELPLAHGRPWGDVGALLHPRTGTRHDNRVVFQQVAEQTRTHSEPFVQHIGQFMQHFEEGVFCGNETLDIPDDNLDLERWIKGPKGHERRIHGRQHVGHRLIEHYWNV